MAEYNPSKIIKDGNTYNFRDTTKIPLAGSNQISGSLIPATDNSIDVGSSTKNLKMLYTKGITIDGGAVLTSALFRRTVDDDELKLCGGTDMDHDAAISLHGRNWTNPNTTGAIRIQPANSTNSKVFYIYPSGTLTWTGQPIQYISDQRLKQQINQIDDKLLDAWGDVNLVQFKYNDAVDQKGDNARLHTGYVVQQIDKACKKHNVDVSKYGLYCHEEYPEETEEVEVEQADGTKTKETKVIREANEHYSLRYTEALIVECKYLRRCIARLTARIEELEKGNNTK